MVDDESGDGRTGLDGLVSELKDLNVDSVSGIGVAFALLAKVGPPGLYRLILQYIASYLIMKTHCTPGQIGGNSSLNTIPFV